MRARLWILRALVAAAVALAIEGMAAAALAWLAHAGVRYQPRREDLVQKQRLVIAHILKGDLPYLDYDSALGWSPRSLGVEGENRANADGMRADREYPRVPQPGLVRMAAFGDSFVHGDEVSFADTWEQRLEAELPGVEVLNFGVGSYGLDQAFMRYESLGREFGAKVVLIGFMTLDVGRALNTFRPFHTRNAAVAMTKPRFVLEGGKLRTIPNPLPRREDYSALLEDEDAALERIGASDSEYQLGYPPLSFDFLRTYRIARLAWVGLKARRARATYFDEKGLYRMDSEAVTLNLAIFEAFAAAVRRDGAEPLVVLFPGREDLRAEAAARRGDVAGYEPLRIALNQRAIPTVDMFGPLQEAGQADSMDGLFGFGHYSPAGHRIVASAIAARLWQMGLIEGRVQ